MTASPQNENIQAAADNSVALESARNMNPEELQRFKESLEHGWKRPQQSRPSLSGDIAKDSTEKTHVLGTSLATSIRVWLSDTFDDFSDLSPRNHAAKALREFVDLPGTRDQLVGFFLAFAEAYEDLLKVRIEVALRTPSKTHPELSDVTCIKMAGDWPAKTRKRLECVSQLRMDSPEEADLFCLHEFSGCTEEELAEYLRLPVEPLREQLQDLRIIVRLADQKA